MESLLPQSWGLSFPPLLVCSKTTGFRPLSSALSKYSRYALDCPYCNISSVESTRMVQIVQVTLKEAEFKDNLAPNAKALVSVRFGESKKSFPNPRIIKNLVCNFYGERLSISSSSQESVDKAYVQIVIQEGKNERNLGEVEIDMVAVRGEKDTTRVKLELENEGFFLVLEALASSYGGTLSELGDKRSEKSEGPISPLKSRSVIGGFQKNLSLHEEVLYTPKDKVAKKEDKFPLTQRKKEELEQSEKQQQFAKKSSLNYSQNRLIEDDRKSEISERPIRRSNVKAREEKDITKEPSVSSSRPNNAINRSPQPQRVEVPAKKTPPPTPTKVPTQPPKPISKAPKPSKSSAPNPEPSFLSQFSPSDLTQFAAVSVLSFFVGMILKKM